MQTLIGGAGVTVGLQWGRTQLSAEIPHCTDISRWHRAASMGPHSTECGNRRLPFVKQAFGSMLQWGRTQLSAEIHIGGDE